jgi:hypothetical protein
MLEGQVSTYKRGRGKRREKGRGKEREKIWAKLIL